MNNVVKYFNNSELSINLTSILILNDQTNEFEPWFIAKEVATLLGYTNVSKAINDHVDDMDQRILSRGECEVLLGQTITNTETIENIDDLKGNDSLLLENPTNISNRGMKFINIEQDHEYLKRFSK